MKPTKVDVYGHLPHDHRQVLLATLYLDEDGTHRLEVACPIGWDILPYCEPFMLGLEGKGFRFNPLHPCRGSGFFDSMMGNMLTDEEKEVSDAATKIVTDTAKEVFKSKLENMGDEEFSVLRDRLHERYPAADVGGSEDT
jgi:hypothetical protein